jgi:hypothetical protein
MKNLQTLLSRALLAAALVTGAGVAAAGPLYHVDIDTSAFSGDGALDITFLPAAEAAVASATASNFTGNYGAYADASAGVSGSVGGTVSFTNTVFAELFQTITLGQRFGFDLSFDGPDSGVSGTAFAVSLMDAFGSSFLVDRPLVEITLRPDAILVDANAAYASVRELPVSDVPEPAEWATLLTGLGLMGFTLRRRSL